MIVGAGAKLGCPEQDPHFRSVEQIFMPMVYEASDMGGTVPDRRILHEAQSFPSLCRTGLIAYFAFATSPRMQAQGP